MVSEMVLAPEGFVADITFVGALVGVRPLVDEQVIGFGELSLAEATDELLLGPARGAAPLHSALDEGAEGRLLLVLLVLHLLVLLLDQHVGHDIG